MDSTFQIKLLLGVKNKTPVLIFFKYIRMHKLLIYFFINCIISPQIQPIILAIRHEQMNKLVSNLLNYGGQWLFSSGIAVKLFLINVSYVWLMMVIMVI